MVSKSRSYPGIVRRRDAGGLWQFFEFLTGNGNSDDDVVGLLKITNPDGTVSTDSSTTTDECLACDLAPTERAFPNNREEVISKFRYLRFECGCDGGKRTVTVSKHADGLYGIYSGFNDRNTYLFDVGENETNLLKEALLQSRVSTWREHYTPEEWGCDGWTWHLELVSDCISLNSSGCRIAPDTFDELRQFLFSFTEPDKRKRKKMDEGEHAFF